MSALIRFIFPFLERMFRFLRTDSRQEYFIGVLAVDSNALIARLRAHGFEDQLFAWVDDGQRVSLRKKDGLFQYHIRIFNDGEVRGHYEYAPEVAPIKHLRRIGREERSSEFKVFVEGYVELSHAQTYQNTISPVMQTTLTPSYRT